MSAGASSASCFRLADAASRSPHSCCARARFSRAATPSLARRRLRSSMATASRGRFVFRSRAPRLFSASGLSGSRPSASRSRASTSAWNSPCASSWTLWPYRATASSFLAAGTSRRSLISVRQIACASSNCRCANSSLARCSRLLMASRLTLIHVRSVGIMPPITARAPLAAAFRTVSGSAALARTSPTRGYHQHPGRGHKKRRPQAPLVLEWEPSQKVWLYEAESRSALLLSHLPLIVCRRTPVELTTGFAVRASLKKIWL